jgi:hypothetical protein
MVGYVRESLLVLDPHISQPHINELSKDAIASLYTNTIRCLPNTAVDPSLCFGFTVANLDAWKSLKTWIARVHRFIIFISKLSSICRILLLTMFVFP